VILDLKTSINLNKKRKLNMEKIVKYLDARFVKARKLINILIVILFGTQVVVVFMQVVARYVFNDPFSWSEEMARYIQVWMILLASSICIRKGSHLSVDYATHSLPLKYKKILKIVVNLLIMFFLFVMTFYGWKIIIVIFGHQTSSAMRIPMYLIYLALPICGLLMILENLISLLKLIGLKSDEDL